ncbi:MAG: class II aldolase/adducin family protein [Clostridiales bacterium]|nr:class II aldolase/adducin family protein [Clostridiales bacterium]
MRRIDRQARRALVTIGKRMYAQGYVASNDGNLSARVRPDEIWATPTGVSKGFMKAKDMVRMKLDGTVLSRGKLAPSSEIRMHLRIYQENPEVTGVCHAHPLMSTSFAVAGVGLDEPIYPEAMVLLGSVPCVPYETPGSQGVPDAVAPYVKSHCAVLLQNHGPVTWGRSLEEAWHRLEAVEHCAQITYNACYMMGKASRLSRKQIDELKAIRQTLGFHAGPFPQGAEDAGGPKDGK